jgi:hypothetical protein
MNLAMLTSQIPLIELGVITSFVLMHFARTFLGLSQSSIAGTFFIVVCTILLLLPFNSLGAPWSLPLVAYVRDYDDVDPVYVVILAKLSPIKYDPHCYCALEYFVLSVRFGIHYV